MRLDTEGMQMRLARKGLGVGATAMVLLVSWSSLGPMIAHAQAAPALKVDPSSGGVGTTVRIAGRGFCGSPACSSVQVSFAGIVVADGIGIASDGGFALSVTVPGGTLPGEKAVAATQTNASGQQLVANTTFQVTLVGATATPSPTSTATPSATASPTTPTSSATTVIGSPTVGGDGSSTALTLAMVVAGGVFLMGLLGMAYVLWRSRAIQAPPSVGPSAPHEDVLAPTPRGGPEAEGSLVPSPEPPTPPTPSEGSGEGQTAG